MPQYESLEVLEAVEEHHVAETLGVLGRRDHRHAEDVGTLDQPAARGGHRLESLVGAEAFLDVDHDDRRTVAREQAHAAPTTESVRRR